MSDESAPVPELDPNPPESPQSPVGIVYGGTTSSYQDAVNQRKRFEESKRRSVSDSLFQRTRENPNEAKMFSRSLQGEAHVIVEYRHRDGVSREYMVCDISMSPTPDGTSHHLVLCIPCPVCILKKHQLVSDSIMLLNQSNRRFELDVTRQGEMWINPADPGEVYMRAGSITSDPFRCQCGCNTRWVIDRDVLKEA